MTLTRYRQKRSFKKTPEPAGGKPDSDQLRFVIQKHAASHLHYDFRLEMEGVLKSWAVPKGPSLNPEVKRLAMMVEDHPYDYRNFEGIIPQGQYGGGTVIVWDEGTYEPLEENTTDKKSQEKVLLKQLKAGRLKFRMKGHKVKGEFALVKVNGRGENGWLLIKHDDAYSTTVDVTKKDKSVQSRKTLEQVAKTSDNIYGRKRSEVAQKKRESSGQPVKKTATAAKTKSPVKKKGNAPFPANIRPMLATLVDHPFPDAGWLYEIKWDGYRAMALMNKGAVELKSRNDKSFNEKFYPVHAALKKLKLNAVLDGEIIVSNEKGISDFGALQNWRSEADGDLRYCVFDITWLDGRDLTSLPLRERREILEDTLKNNEIIQVSKSFEVPGTDFFAHATTLGLEGIIAKKAESLYLPGARSRDWLKIKANKRQEVVIGGFTRNKDSPKLFSALLVGVFENGKLQYTGKIGTGFSDKLQSEMMALFKKHLAKKSPFAVTPDVSKPSRFRPNPPAALATWLKPHLVCEVSFTELTSDGIMRHPSFEGMRIDKSAKAVHLEKEVSSDEITHRKKQSAKKVLTPAARKERKSLLNPTDETQVREVNGHSMKFTNLGKIYWPKEKITKRDMLNYYYQVAPFMLPYLVDRPMSLNRHPDGINGGSFYQKDVTGKAPEWIDTFPYFSEADQREKNFLVCTDEASLLFMASLGCIEINPWSSTIHSPDKPDWCILDLDPDKNTFDHVIEAANVCREVLDEIKVPSYCKTSGSTGMHIYIPLGAQYTYEESKEFARAIVKIVHARLPRFTSVERTVAKRNGRMYLDFLQNRAQATLAAPYSLRPKPGATVSMPLHWDEVKKGLKMQDFHIFNAMDRLKQEGDIFKKVLGKGFDMQRAIARLEKLPE